MSAEREKGLWSILESTEFGIVLFRTFFDRPPATKVDKEASTS
jgi:hypothetical protein